MGHGKIEDLMHRLFEDLGKSTSIIALVWSIKACNCQNLFQNGKASFDKCTICAENDYCINYYLNHVPFFNFESVWFSF